MKRKDGNHEIMPVNIRLIRQKLGMTLKQMGSYAAFVAQGVNNTPVPATRISEWESGWRAVPDYVFTAAARILLDNWSDDRHAAPHNKQLDVDVFYSSVLNEPLGELFRLERDFKRSKIRDFRKLAKHVRRARISQMKYLEKVLNIEFAYVFEPNQWSEGLALEDVA